MKIKLLILFLIVSAGNIYGQQELKNIVPLSPNSAEFTKYGEIPVGYFTGVPQISIPIFSVRSGKMELPLTLNYHAGGNKVESTPSWVGLGWSLSTIPVITRGINGQPDEGENGYFYKYNGRTIKQMMDDPNTGTTADMYNYLTLAREGKADPEPDMYYYSLNGTSGKFYYNQQTESFVTMSRDNTIIKRDGGFFTITADNGDIYSFSEKEYTENKSNPNAQPTATSWYAKKIVNAGRTDSIVFTYEEEIQKISQYTSHTLFQKIGGEVAYCALDAGKYPGGPNSDLESRVSNNWTTAKVIKRIDFNGGYVLFNKGGLRSDLNGGTTLDNIEVFSGSQPVTKFTFHYFYKTASANTNCLTADPYNLNWLFLKEMRQTNFADTAHLDHRFEYLESAIPCRGSTAQDYWGYFNGQISNQTLIPTTHLNVGNNFIQIPGANRAVNPVYSQFGMLRRIVYPSKGYTDFKFENNTVDSEEVPENYELITQTLHGEKIDEEFEIETPVNNTYSKVFVINNPPHQFLNNNNAHGGTFIKIDFSDLGCDFSQGDTECANISLRRLDNNEVIYNNLGYPVFSKYIENGTYEMTVTFNRNFNPPPDYGYFTYNISYQQIAATGNSPYAGGLRIKEIRNYDGVSTAPATFRSFKYVTDIGSEVSSGQTFGFGNFNYTDNYSYISRCEHPSLPGLIITSTAEYLRIKAYPNIPQVTHSGSYVGYSTVLAQADSTGNSMLSLYQYDNEIDIIDPTFPYPPPQSMDSFRGNLILEKHFKLENAQYIPVKKIENVYLKSHIESSVVYGMKSGSRVGSNVQGGSAPLPEKIYYELRSSISRLVQKKETEYFSSDTTKKLQTLTNYNYDPERFYLTSTRMINSEGVVTKDSLRYPFHFAGIDPYAGMLQKNIVNPVIESSLYKNNVFIQSSRTNYGLWHNKFFAPLNIDETVGNALPVTKVNFSKYNTMGRVLSVSQLVAPDAIYIWSYGGEYPIAEIRNMDYDLVVSLLGGQDNLNSWYNKANPTQAEIMSFLSPLRSAAPAAAHITSYSYKPLVGMASQTDVKGQTTYYEYDKFNRLNIIRDHRGNLVKMYCYNYAGQQQDCGTGGVVAYSSAAKSQTFTRNNCGTGGAGSQVVYSVPAGKHTSTISQADADAKAQNDLNTNGQNYANANGQCSYWFSNSVRSQTFVKNNCGSGGSGSQVIYTVNAGAYTSAISQADADTKAQNDINANGQAYANANGNCTYSNAAKSQVFTKNNCLTGGSGSQVTYTVNAGAYTSTISQADADAKAQNDVATNGQTYANNNGNCTYGNAEVSRSFSKNNCTGGAGSAVTYIVPAGKYTSTISQADANALAENDINANGQAKANAEGQCVFSNVYMDVLITKNDCGDGMVGMSYRYELNPGKYTSLISQADADAKAQNDIATIGQAEANLRAGCWYANVSMSRVIERNNCNTGAGSGVVYTVPAGKYLSRHSQADANTQAENEINTNGQAYANANGTCLYVNTLISQVFTRNNCTGTNYGGQVTYVVAQGKYTSTISKADADAKAVADITANGQNYANLHGACLPCTGIDKKVINGVCVTGVKTITNSVPNGNQYKCFFKITWPDGSSVTGSEMSNTPCQGTASPGVE